MPNSEYRFPAEWETHSATWLTWPHNRETWPQNLAEAQAEFEVFVRTLAEVEDVNLLACGKLAEHLRERFSAQPRITIFEIATNDSWIRDYGPTFVKSKVNGSIVGVDWVYNGWGEKYPPFDADQRAAIRMLDSISTASINSQLILEGGAIESNGETICLTTHSCIQQRNPQLTAQQIEAELVNRLGLDQILQLHPVEIEGDDTDGHIDQVARFVSPSQVVVSDRQWNSVAPDLENIHLEVVRINDPEQVRMYGVDLPASYTNFYVANGIVITPRFDDPGDQPAIQLLAELFPNHQVIGLPSRHLTVGLGSFHCLSQQQPA